METVEKDYGRIRKVFGSDRVNGLIREMKEQERLQAEIERGKQEPRRRK